MKFKKTTVGDWVEAINSGSHWDGLIGYIEDEREGGGEFKFRAVRHRTRGRMAGAVWIPKDYFKPLEEGLTKSDIDQLIDWALDERDKETFDRLVAIRNMSG